MSPDQKYLELVGVDWCTEHCGLRNEDENECDMADGRTECELVPLFIEAVTA